MEQQQKLVDGEKSDGNFQETTAWREKQVGNQASRQE